MAVGLVLIVLFAGVRPAPIASVATALLIAGAALTVGALVGFLFGIPRVVQAQAPSQERYGVNTNLEQISDWLTKIIVGLGLVQLGKIPARFTSLAEYLAAAFESSPVPGSLVAAALAYFGTCGFLSGYLWARLFLPLEFSRAERAARESPEYQEGLIHALLYQSPDGYARAIEEGESYLGRFGRGNYRVWLYLACAYAQQYSQLTAEGATVEKLADAKKHALDAARRVRELNPSEVESLRALWDPTLTTAQEDDLAVFADDEDFKRFFAEPVQRSLPG